MRKMELRNRAITHFSPCRIMIMITEHDLRRKQAQDDAVAGLC